MALLAWLEQQTGKPTADLFADEAGESRGAKLRNWCGRWRSGWSRGARPVRRRRARPSRLISARDAHGGADEDKGPSILCSAVSGCSRRRTRACCATRASMVAEGRADRADRELRALARQLGSPKPAPTAADPATPAPSDAEVPAPPESPVALRAFATSGWSPTPTLARRGPCRLARSAGGWSSTARPARARARRSPTSSATTSPAASACCSSATSAPRLDVVADRLQTLGLGDLLATVHDPQRDQRELLSLGPRAVGQSG